jgi:hypothetical protein
VKDQAMKIAPILADDVVVLASWRSVLVARWKRVPTPAQMRSVRRAIRGVVSRSGEFAAINFVEARNATALPDDVRDEIAATQREFDHQQRALATVVEGTGFWAATVRSVAVGLALMSRTRFPQRVFGRSDDACAWVAPLLADVGDGNTVELRAAVAATLDWT